MHSDDSQMIHGYFDCFAIFLVYHWWLVNLLGASRRHMIFAALANL